MVGYRVAPFLLQDHVSKPLEANLGNRKVRELVDLLYVMENGDVNELCMCTFFLITWLLGQLVHTSTILGP